VLLAIVVAAAGVAMFDVTTNDAAVVVIINANANAAANDIEMDIFSSLLPGVYFCSRARASEIKVLKRELKNERKKRRERKESLLLRGLLPFSSTSIISCSRTYSSIGTEHHYGTKCLSICPASVDTLSTDSLDPFWWRIQNSSSHYV
jgi:hypothetical protein